MSVEDSLTEEGIVFSRPGNGNGTDAARIIGDMGKVLSRVLDNSSLVLVNAEEIPHVNCPVEDFRRAMEILVTAALTPVNGERQARVKVGVTSSEKLVVFSIRSSLRGAFGPRAAGVSSRFRPRGASGPLAEAKDLAQRNWGCVWVGSDEESGSVAYLMVPRANQ